MFMYKNIASVNNSDYSDLHDWLLKLIIKKRAYEEKDKNPDSHIQFTFIQNDWLII